MSSTMYPEFSVVDFAVILKHLNYRFQNHSKSDLESFSDFNEFASDFIGSINEKVNGVSVDLKPHELETTGIVYSLVWLDRFSSRLHKGIAPLDELIFNATTDSNIDIHKIKSMLEHENLPHPHTFSAMIRVFDRLHENLIDGSNLLRIIKNTPESFFMDFTDRLDGVTRSIRYLDWNYFNLAPSYA